MNFILYLLVIISWVTTVGCSLVISAGDAGSTVRDDSIGFTGQIPDLSARIEVKNGIFDK
ncbi:uncharacterized protein CELE_C16C4.1 [Caenorhabditis elegans]|uniref:Secreted protein n=1 Tax=Caenorhabditis elegans TaxID=6239 RepID=O44325_CAEEL|nr:Secreted protein [Caenorhabditis elegans]CCD64667.2 Secreted protein [Caenorhabditis elegans]|eukprot:NP_494114.3 Uncharacterized protein CELE_C16C4.1 [Caenorhabditis elegans]